MTTLANVKRLERDACEQFVLKACFLGYKRGTGSLFVPRGKSPDPWQRVLRARAR